MKAIKHKWLCIYYAPNGIPYYRYGATKSELKEWFSDKIGTAEFFKLSYTKAGTQTNHRAIPYHLHEGC